MPTTRTPSTTRIAWCAIAAASLLIAACGGASSDADPNSDGVSTSSANASTVPASEDETIETSPSTSAPDSPPLDTTDTTATETTTTATTEPIPVTDVVLATPDWTGLERWRLPALGGMTLGVPEGSSVHHDGDMVMVQDRWSIDRGRSNPAVVVALISATIGSGIEPTVESVTTIAIDRYGDARQSGTRLELFDHELIGWDFERRDRLDGDELRPLNLFPAMPSGARGESFWDPFPLARLYLADTKAGVLAVGYIASTDAEFESAAAMFERVAPTVELDGLRSDVPVVGTAHPSPRGFPGAVDIPDGWPPLLDLNSQALPAGDYSINKLGSPLRLSIDDGWWVQPNFLGMVVLTGADSFGPGDRAVALRQSLDTIVAVSDAFEPIGEPLPIGDEPGWPTDALSTLIVEAEIEVEIDGHAVRRFDVRVDDDAECTDESPCQYDLLAPVGPVQTLRKGYRYRIWEFVDRDETPITLIAQSANADWFDRADELVDSVRLSAP